MQALCVQFIFLSLLFQYFILTKRKRPIFFSLDNLYSWGGIRPSLHLPPPPHVSGCQHTLSLALINQRAVVSSGFSFSHILFGVAFTLGQCSYSQVGMRQRQSLLPCRRWWKVHRGLERQGWHRKGISMQSHFGESMLVKASCPTTLARQNYKRAVTIAPPSHEYSLFHLLNNYINVIKRSR